MVALIVYLLITVHMHVLLSCHCKHLGFFLEAFGGIAGILVILMIL